MRIDIYTKAVLTVIAGALIWLCVQNSLSPQVVSASRVIGQQVSESRVIISGFQISEGGGSQTVQRLDGNGLPVTIKSK
jgi:hypothetical protein